MRSRVHHEPAGPDGYGAPAMTSRDVVRSFWSAMQDNDWTRAAGHLADGCAIDWPGSGERIVGPDAFAEV